MKKKADLLDGEGAGQEVSDIEQDIHQKTMMKSSRTMRTRMGVTFLRMQQKTS
jgi:hypothetical protein